MLKDWIEVELGEACGIYDNLRKPINSKERNSRIEGKNESELFPYYGATGQVGYIDGYLTDGEFVLIGEDGAPFFDYSKDVAYLIKGKTWVNNHAHILLSHFNNKFLLHYLNQFNFYGFVSGTTRLKLTQNSLKQMPVPIAPLPEQRAIAAKIEQLFSELDNGIANLKAAKSKLEIYRQAILKQAFEGNLTKDWRKKQPKNHGNHVNQKNHSADNLPETWKWVKLSEVANHITDGDHQAPPKASEGIPFITISNIDKSTNRIDFSNTFYVEKEYYFNLKENKKPQKGDILYTVTGSFGIPVLIDFIKDFCFQRHIGLIRPLESINQKWLYWLLQTRLVYGQASEKATGTAQKTVALSILRNITIPFCLTEEQTQIVQEIETRLSVCDKLNEAIDQSLEKAQALRQSILKKAFEGKLLSQDELQNCRQQPDWEPAAKLLERVKKDSKPKK